MSTLREITTDIFNMMHAGRGNDDSSISYFEVEYWVKTTRAMLIRQDLGKGRTVSENIVQHLMCQKVIPVDTNDCPECLNNFSGCYIARTEKPMPRFIEIPDRDLFLSAQPSNILSQNYTLIPRNRVSYIRKNKWGKDMPYIFMRNNFLYIIGDPDTEWITVEGVYEDPTELANYTNCVSGSPCYQDEDRFPISEWMIELMKQMILKNNSLIMSTGMDLSEDGNPNTAIPSQKPPIR